MTVNPEDRQAHALAEQERHDDRDRWSDDAIDREPVIGRRGKRRLAWIAAALIVIALLVTLPPLLNINRYQHRIASAIAQSIGRPVRFDSIELHLLPLPGFTIHNFVVMEDGRFGAEPAMRANVMEARVRFSSLWRRRVEISRIRLQSPTVNLVRNDAGYWNVQGVVSQAAQVQSAPTAQRRAGGAPRFPYIEATDARVNLKLGDTKLPYALTDAEFALWLPNQQEWRLRLAGRPLRTDTDASDVGEVRLEASLGRTGVSTAQEPLSLQATWKPTPLGEASKLAVGSDTGWRGSISAELQVQGTPAAMRITTDMHLRDLRRAEFVPAETLELDTHCEAEAIGVAHEFRGVRCALPTAKHGSLLDGLPFSGATTAAAPAPDVLTLQAEVPNTMDLRSATATLDLQHASPEWALRWMRLFSSRIPATTTVGGSFSVHLRQDPAQTTGWTGNIACHCTLPTVAAKANATTDATASQAATNNPWFFQAIYPAASFPDAARAKTGAVSLKGALFAVTAVQQPEAAKIAGEPEPRASGAAAITGTVGFDGATLQYTFAETARQLATLLPALGDDLPPTLTGPVSSERVWGKTQAWTAAGTLPAASRHHRQRRRP